MTIKFPSRLIFSAFSLGLLAGCGDKATDTSENKQDSTAAGRAPVAMTAPKLEDTFKAEIDALSAHPQVKEAFQFIEDYDEQTIKTLITLTEIEAPPYKEKNRSDKYLSLLKEAGADSVWQDEVWNAIGLVKGTKRGKVLAFCAHLDTVFPEGTDTRVQQSGDTLKAPGISDDTRGLAILITIMKAIRKAGIQPENDILFIGNVGEEGQGDLRGAKYLFGPNGPKIDAFISVDGSGHESVTNQALGSHRYRITFEGPGGHSWGAFGLGNPHHALGRAITYFTDEADKFTRGGPKTNYNVGVISGGTSVNSIPFESIMEVDMRSESPESLVKVDTILQQAVRKALADQNKLKRHGPDLTVKIEMIGDRPSGEHPESMAIVQRGIAATQFVGGRPTLRRGSTDSNIPISKGIPAITIGGGGMGRNAHSLDEYFINKDGVLGIKRALLIVLAEVGIDDEMRIESR
jgi:tripeptide aminopeptidase